MNDSQTTQPEVEVSPAKDPLKLPWRLKIEPGRRKFCEETGKPLGPRDYIWVQDATGRPIQLFIGEHDKADNREAVLAKSIIHRVNLHEELVTALNGVLVALRLGAHVDEKAAIDYGMQVLAKAKGGAE